MPVNIYKDWIAIDPVKKEDFCGAGQKATLREAHSRRINNVEREQLSIIRKGSEVEPRSSGAIPMPALVPKDEDSRVWDDIGSGMMVIVVRVKVSSLYGPCINIIDWELWVWECGFTFIGMIPNIIGMETKAPHRVTWCTKRSWVWGEEHH